MSRILLALIFLPLFSWAETVDVKGVEPSGADGDTTTIEIRKGKKAEEALKGDKAWEITEGTADISGDSGATAQDAKANWNKACNEWKKEFRSDNKDNKIISMNCGKHECGGEAGNRTCTSTANYKIKTKVN